MDSTRVPHDALLALDAALLTAPVEQLRRHSRTTQRLIEAVLAHTAQRTARDTSYSDPDSVIAALDETASRLVSLRARAAERRTAATAALDQCEARTTHLLDLVTATRTSDPSFQRYAERHTNRLLADYLLRTGRHRAARELLTTSTTTTTTTTTPIVDNSTTQQSTNNNDTSQLAKQEPETTKADPNKMLYNLADYALFTEAAEISTALRAHDPIPCLRWVGENRSALERVESTLEFELRLQEYIELVKLRKLKEAIEHSRKHLFPFRTTHFTEISHAIALIGFPTSTSVPAYKSLFDERRWEAIVHRFRADCYAIHGLPARPPLVITLQAGLTALKTQHCAAVIESALKREEIHSPDDDDEEEDHKHRHRRNHRRRHRKNNNTGHKSQSNVTSDIHGDEKLLSSDIENQIGTTIRRSTRRQQSQQQPQRGQSYDPTIGSSNRTGTNDEQQMHVSDADKDDMDVEQQQQNASSSSTTMVSAETETITGRRRRRRNQQGSFGSGNRSGVGNDDDAVSGQRRGKRSRRHLRDAITDTIGSGSGSGTAIGEGNTTEGSNHQDNVATTEEGNGTRSVKIESDGDAGTDSDSSSSSNSDSNSVSDSESYSDDSESESVNSETAINRRTRRGVTISSDVDENDEDGNEQNTTMQDENNVDGNSRRAGRSTRRIDGNVRNGLEDYIYGNTKEKEVADVTKRGARPRPITKADNISECPVCDINALGRLAQNLPHAHHVNSSMVDPRTGQFMDESNPPMMLPNGHLISQSTVDLLKRAGKIQCPNTGEIFEVSEIRRLYIL